MNLFVKSKIVNRDLVLIGVLQNGTLAIPIFCESRPGLGLEYYIMGPFPVCTEFNLSFLFSLFILFFFFFYFSLLLFVCVFLVNFERTSI